MLTQREVIQYLLHHKLLDPLLLVAGGLKVENISRRNVVFKVITAHGSSYLVKQGTTSDMISTVEYEASVYRLLNSDPNISALLSRYIPSFVAYDVTEHLLLLELLQNSEDLSQRHSHRRRFAKSVGMSMAKALSTVHSSQLVHINNHCRPTVLTQRVPWALTIHRPPLALFREASAANLQLIRIIQGSREFCDQLDDLRHNWCADRLIHRDAKLENWINHTESSTSRRYLLKLVDWEFATMGDACWDVGCVFGGYLCFWLASFPITGLESPERFLELSSCPLERIQPLLCAFWNTYRAAMGLGNQAPEWLLRSTRYAAVRLVQTAFEQSTRRRELTGNVVALLQLSLNILRRPGEAASLLFSCLLQEGQ